MEEPKAKSKSISLLPELWVKVEAQATASYGGNRSSYIRELVEQDLAGGVVAGALTPQQIDRWLEDERALLEANVHAMAFLYNPDAQAKATAAARMAEIISRAVIRQPSVRPPLEELPMVAEDPAAYGVPVPPKPEIHSPSQIRGAKKKA